MRNKLHRLKDRQKQKTNKKLGYRGLIPKYRKSSYTNTEKQQTSLSRKMNQRYEHATHKRRAMVAN